ncbi:MAG: magnesium transporter CorA family protein [Candidatus Thorarchaeota archaeon]|nr:MAG: magnesium transporter CorA family protein [Candidatus Thorarchaeota archaeon]
MTTAEKPDASKLTVTALESGIEYEDLRSAPDEPLLIQVVGIWPDILAELSQKFEVDLEDLQDLQDLDERPRLQIEDKFIMIVLRVPVDLERAEREYSTNPIGIFSNGRDIIIIQNAEIPLRKNRLKGVLKRTTTVSGAIYNIWEIVIHSFETTLDIVEATINETEDRILREIYPSQLDRFFQLSRDAIFMEAALKSNMKVLRRMKRLQSFGHLLLDEDRLEELEVDLQQQMELSAIYRELIDNAMKEYDSIVGHNLNTVMKTLTSISLLVSVPTLIASIYGMNVGLPLANDPLAFVVVLVTSFIITAPLLVFLRVRGLV